MSHPSPLSLRILQCLRLKGYADAAAIAEVTGAGVEAVMAELAPLQDGGLVHVPGARRDEWALTSEGRAENTRQLRAELDQAGVRGPVEDAYRRFLDLNVEVREICTAWQIRDDALNDHSDRSYDREVVERLVDLHGRARPICIDLTEQLERFSRYDERLDASVERVVGGDGAYVAQPLIDSYHTVWFELHEDLLTTLGTTRAAEAARA